MANTQINSFLNQAYAMWSGSSDVGTLTTQGIIDAGGDSLTASKEQFFGALLNVMMKNRFNDSEYNSRENDVFFEDAQQYGAIMQLISVDIPAAVSNPAWASFVSAYDDYSNATKLHDTPVYLPVVRTKFYEGSVSWAIPLALTGQQIDTAVHDAAELEQVAAYCWVAVDNAVKVHLEGLNRTNRNNFIAQKISAYNGGTAGIHKINLVEAAYNAGLYPSANAGDKLTAVDFMNNKNKMLFATEQIKMYKSYFGTMSKLFNTAQRDRFTPDDRMVLQVLSAFARKLETVALSDTYHKDIVEMPLYREVAAWQGLGTDTSWNNVSAVDVQLSTSPNVTVTQTGVVALLVDRWAIMHTIKSRRVGVDRDDIKDLTAYSTQFRDSYFNDLTMNGLVFTVEDYEIPEITLSKSTTTIATGATESIVISSQVPSGATVTYTSSNTAKATVSDAGVITGVAAGSAIITATVKSGGNSASASITVTVT